MYNLNESGGGIGSVSTGAGIQPTVQLATAPTGGYAMPMMMGGNCGGVGGDWLGALLLIALLGNGRGFGGGFGGGGCDGVGNLHLSDKMTALSSQVSAGDAAIIANNNSQSIVDAVRSVDSAVCNGFLQTQKGFGDVALNSCQQTGLITNAINGVNTAMLLGNQQLSSQIADCCCTTQRAIDGVNYNAAKNTCDIVNAIHADGEATRGLITSNTIQDLRDKLTEANLKSSQAEQNNYLVNTLRPSPVPSYPVYSPCSPIFTPVISGQSFCGAPGTGLGGCGTL